MRPLFPFRLRAFAAARRVELTDGGAGSYTSWSARRRSIFAIWTSSRPCAPLPFDDGCTATLTLTPPRPPQIFIKPLRYADPPVVSPHELDELVDDVFGNLSAVREANRRLLEIMNVRQREQAVVVQRVGDILLEAATEFRLVYPTYIGHLPLAEKRLKEEAEANAEFRLFLEVSPHPVPPRRVVSSLTKPRRAASNAGATPTRAGSTSRCS